MRNIGLVAYDLYNIIPDNVDEKFTNFKQQINKNILESIRYSPKEQVRSNWYWNILSSFNPEFGFEIFGFLYTNRYDGNKTGIERYG